MPRWMRGTIASFLVALALFSAAAVAAPKWEPPDMAEFAIRVPVVDAEAGAEVILRDVTMDSDEGYNPTVKHRVRIRVFNLRGVESVAKVELPYVSGSKIKDVAVRTIKPDGTVLEPAAKDIYDREVVKAGKNRTRVTSFSPVGLEPGVVVEYRYTVILDEPPFFFPLIFQGEWPARLVRYHVNAIQIPGLALQALFFYCPTMGLNPDKRGFMHFELTNIPAYRAEPFSPPELNVKSAIMMFYGLGGADSLGDFWTGQSSALHAEAEVKLAPTKALKAALAAAVGDATDPREKAKRIYDYCRTRIQNRQRDTFQVKAADRAKLPVNKTPSDTLKNGNGWSRDINLLFAALCRTAGLPVRLALANDRDAMLIGPHIKISHLLNYVVVGVRIDAEWSYYDPGSTYLPPGELSWYNTDTFLLPGTSEGEGLVWVPGAEAEKSKRTRVATCVLEADGTLTGEVEICYTGLWEADMKYILDGRTQEEREATVREEWATAQPLAEVSDVVIENAADPIKPLCLRYKIKVPSYADATGSRLFLQPSVFRKGAAAPLTETKRKTMIVFRLRSIDEDRVEIRLPSGYTVEAGAAPGNASFGAMGSYHTDLGMKRTAQATTVYYQREAKLDATMIDAKWYGSVLSAFEDMHQRDGHTLTLKRVAPEPDGDPAAAKAPSSEKSSTR